MSRSEYNNEKNSTNKRRKSNNLDATTRIRIDRDRLNDTQTLDTSFLDKNINKKGSSLKKKKDKMLAEKELTRRYKDNSFGLKSFFSGLIFLILIIFVFGIVVLIFNNFDHIFKIDNEDKTVKQEKVTKEVKLIDDNYLFLGDSITDYYDLDKYFEDLPVVNSGINGNTTEDILNDMRNRVYIYNPSKVFILIGVNDLIKDISCEETVDNIKHIIEDIKENRPYCEIYLESIYPINDSDVDEVDLDMVDNRSNEDIKNINKELKKLAKEEKITYIDLYDELADKDGKLKLDYTTEGLHISDKGYEVITNKLIKYIED